MSSDKFRMTVAGGSRVGGIGTLYALAERARPLLEAGWPVFLRNTAMPVFVVEVKWTTTGELEMIRSDRFISPKWLEDVSRLFSPGS